jgi:hypothetical protein
MLSRVAPHITAAMFALGVAPLLPALLSAFLDLRASHHDCMLTPVDYFRHFAVARRTLWSDEGANAFSEASANARV